MFWFTFAEIWWMPLFFPRVLKSASRLVRLKVARKALSDEWAQMWMSNSMTMIESCQCWERERSSIYPRLPPDCKTTLAEHKRSFVKQQNGFTLCTRTGGYAQIAYWFIGGQSLGIIDLNCSALWGSGSCDLHAIKSSMTEVEGLVCAGIRVLCAY